MADIDDDEQEEECPKRPLRGPLLGWPLLRIWQRC